MRDIAKYCLISRMRIIMIVFHHHRYSRSRVYVAYSHEMEMSISSYECTIHHAQKLREETVL